MPEDVANEIAQLLFKKPKHREKCLTSLSKALSKLQPDKKNKHIELLDEWSVVTDNQLKAVMEGSSLSDFEQDKLENIIARVGAFKPLEKTSDLDPFDDIPF